MNHRSRRGFTLLELMVVMVIIGIGMMAITPRIVQRTAGIDRRIEFIDQLLAEELTRAQETGKPVLITGFLGSENLQKSDGKRVKIPDISSIQSAEVNTMRTSGLEYYFYVYPDGLTDRIRLTLDNGDIIETIPLLLKSRVKP